MRRHSGIIKELGLFILLFVLVGAVAASDDIHTVSVKIEQTSSSENDGDTVTNTYNKEIETTESTNVEVTGAISDDDASVITNMGETTTNEDDTTTENADSAAMPEFEISKSPDEFTAALSKWISSMLDESSIVKMDDFSLQIR